MRKQGILKLVLMLLLAVVIASGSFAQTGRGGKKKSRSDKTKRPGIESQFVDRLWVGGNLADLALFGNTFLLGLTPVAAYEVNDFLMVGPFVRMAYRYERQDQISYSTFDVGPGIFARAEVFRDFFLQVDYEAAFLDLPVIPYRIDGAGKIVTERNQQNYLYLGLGYSSGNERSKFTVSLHYNVLDDIDYLRIPWDVRFGMLFRIGKPPIELPSDR